MFSIFKKTRAPFAPQSQDPREILSKKFPGVAFGEGVQIIGLDQVLIGEGSCVGDGVWINDCNRDRVGRLRIGRQVLVGRRSVLSTAGALEIGDFCIFAPDVFVADADHVFADPFQPILQQGVSSNRTVVVEENCWLAIGVRVIGEVTIGRGSVIGAGAIVLKSLPPFCVAVGTPVRVVKLFDFETHSWIATPDASAVSLNLERRSKYPAPSREQYRETLNQANRLGPLGPELAGNQIHF